MQINNFFKAIIIILLGALGGTIAWLFVFKNQPASVQLINKEERIYIEENAALVNAIKSVKDSVVVVKTEYKQKEIQGFGLVLTADGLVVTLAENVPQGSQTSISIRGENNITYQVLKRNLENNLALIKVDRNNLQTKGFFDLSKLETGERIFVLFDGVNEGIVKSFNDSLIKTNIIEIETISGAPAFDVKGEVVGIGDKDTNNFVNIIPITKIKSFAGL